MKLLNVIWCWGLSGENFLELALRAQNSKYLGQVLYQVMYDVGIYCNFIKLELTKVSSVMYTVYSSHMIEDLSHLCLFWLSVFLFLSFSFFLEEHGKVATGYKTMSTMSTELHRLQSCLLFHSQGLKVLGHFALPLGSFLLQHCEVAVLLRDLDNCCSKWGIFNVTPIFRRYTRLVKYRNSSLTISPHPHLLICSIGSVSDET